MWSVWMWSVGVVVGLDVGMFSEGVGVFVVWSVRVWVWL